MTTARQKRVDRLQYLLDTHLRNQRRDLEMYHDIPGWGWEEEYELHSIRIKKIRLVLAELIAAD